MSPAEFANPLRALWRGWNGLGTPEAPERLEFTGSENAAIPARSVTELQSTAPVTPATPAAS